MRSLKRFIYSVIGITVFVVLPAFFIVSNHLEKNFPGNDYIVTDVTGRASVQYQIDHNLGAESENKTVYRRKSKWIPLKRGMKIGTGASIKIEKRSSLDLMKNDEMALRIKEGSLLKLEHKGPADTYHKVTLAYGKVLCRVNGKQGSKSKPTGEKFRVTTPKATAHVRGTSFSVDYQPGRNITNVEVLEGLVIVKSKKFNMEFKVAEGKKIQIAPNMPVPIFDILSLPARKELQEAHNLKINPSVLDQWDQAVLYATATPLFKKAMVEITKYEMKVFIRAIKYFAPLRWDHNVPDSLRDVELDEGDYKDPWDNEYLYEKIKSTKAILISAGYDEIFHTADDIFMPINTQN